MALRITGVDAIHAIHKQIGMFPRLDDEKFAELWNEWNIHHRPEIFLQLIGSNLRLVSRVAKVASMRDSVDFLDLYQAGCMALIRATEMFEPARHLKFSTYSVPAIKRAIYRAVLQSKIIPVQEDTAQRMVRASGTEKKLHQELGRRPTRKEVIERLFQDDEERADEDSKKKSNKWTELQLEMYEKIHRSVGEITSLNLPVGEGGGAVLGELLPEAHKIRATLKPDTVKRLNLLIEKLDERERFVFHNRILPEVFDMRPLWLEAVGQKFGRDKKHASVWEGLLRKKLKTHFAHVFNAIT